MDFGVTFQTDPPQRRDRRAHAAGRGARLPLRVDVRLPHPVAGAVRDLCADARGDGADHRRPLRHEPGDPRPDGDRLAVRDAQRGCSATARSAGSAAATRRGACSARKPTTLAETEGAMHIIKELAEGRPIYTPAGEVPIPWVRDGQARRVAGRLRAEGARARRAQGRRLHPPARRPGDPAVDRRARACGGGGGRPQSRRHRDLCRRARRTSATTSRTRATSAAGSAAWSATTSPTSSAATARAARSPRR